MDGTLTERAGHHVLRFERHLNQPPAETWRALIEPDRLAAWFPQDGAYTGARAAGGTPRFSWREGDDPPFGGEIVAFDPPRLFEYTWDDETLRWELRPDGAAGCLLVFIDTMDAPPPCRPQRRRLARLPRRARRVVGRPTARSCAAGAGGRPPRPLRRAFCLKRGMANGRVTDGAAVVNDHGVWEGIVLKISHSSVFVDDQDKARRFYTEVLGFVVKHDLPIGGAKWLTVVSPAAPEGVELLLEPNGNPAAEAYQAALRAQGIPATMFTVDDIQGEYERLTERGVAFQAPPTEAGGATSAVFDDTCGNLISIVQVT